MSTSNITDEAIEEAFRGTNFGHANHRKLLEASVFKKAVGYHCGHTVTVIMEKLCLITKKGLPTKKGQAFLAHAFNDLMRVGG